jgi:Protein of unknown function (DUF5131)
LQNGLSEVEFSWARARAHPDQAAALAPSSAPLRQQHVGPVHEDAPDEWIDRVFAIMAACPQHLFQALTKRAERVRTIRLVTISSSSRCGPPRHGGYLTRWPAAAQYKDRY